MLYSLFFALNHDFAVPLDHNIVDKEQEKITNYGELAQVIRINYRCKTKIVPIVVGAFGIVTKNLPTFFKQLGIPDVVGGLQMMLHKAVVKAIHLREGNLV